MRFYLRNWGESTNLEIVPHSGPYSLAARDKRRQQFIMVALSNDIA